MSFGTKTQHHHHRPDGNRTAFHAIRLCFPAPGLLTHLIFSLILLISRISVPVEGRTTTDDMTITRSPEDQLRIRALTWNVGTKGPEEDLRPALGLEAGSVTTNSSNMPDIFLFAWQEVPVRVSYVLLEDPWIESVKDVLRPHDYVKLKATKMQGILIATFIRRSFVTRVRDVETAFVRTGFNGLWGNKGAVSVRFSLNGCHVCLLSVHLAAHDHELDRRIQDYADIRDGMEFKNLRSPKILDHDHVILMGDLNFRINDYSANEIYERITEGSDQSRQQLLQKDQLNLVRSQKRALSEFTESPVTFWPTYKFKVGTSVYDLNKRKPAFTDRVLYKDPGSNRVTQDLYKPFTQFVNSDHKPVASSFRMSLFRSSDARRVARDTMDHPRALHEEEDQKEHIVVDFRPIDRWLNDDDERDVHFAYRDTRDKNSRNNEAADRLHDREWDWVAVVPHDFDSLDQWISYAWVTESRLREGDLVPIPGPSGATVRSPAAGFSGEEMEDPRSRPQSGSGTHYALHLDPILNPGSQYRLIYFHGETATSVLGVSDAFTVHPSAAEAQREHLD